MGAGPFRDGREPIPPNGNDFRVESRTFPLLDFLSATPGMNRLPFSAAQREGTELRVGTGEQSGVGVALGQRDPDSAHGDANLRPDLQQFQAQRIALRSRPLGSL